jgi:Protein of unknown function (DUF664)
MAITDPKDDLQRYLQTARDAVLWKLDGLAEYDAPRPLTPTGTSLVGLVKHLARVEAELGTQTSSASSSTARPGSGPTTTTSRPGCPGRPTAIGWRSQPAPRPRGRSRDGRRYLVAADGVDASSHR